jgi:acetylglutamate kinase
MTYVLKLGGEVIGSDLLPVLAADLTRVARAVVVHGGGAQATAMQKRLGQEPKIVSGRRITDGDALDVMKMIVAGKLNVDLCSALIKAGAKPIGLHGASSQVVSAVRRPPKVIAGAGAEPIDFGYVGDVTGLNTSLLTLLLDHGFLPVLACLGADATGQVYNINADTVANGVATNLGADGLVLISDVPGVMRDLNDPSSRIATMTKAEAEAAIKDGVVTKGMIPKLEEAFAAIAAGVKRVFILGKLGPGDLFRALSEPGSLGTVLT